jgi:sterol desaturase/sphingolipid hydroxylase (fatty acid hydroxylase superfamily)
MSGFDALLCLCAVLSAVIVATLIEYFVHRLMHWGILYAAGHRYHHQSGDARTYVRDLLDYGAGAALAGWIGFLISVPVGIGWALGAIIYTMLAAYAHQLQHAHVNLVFWMPRPVHRIHHALDMTEHNFGVLVDWWDRLFGTYRSIESPAPVRRRLTDYTEISWG